MFKDFDGVISSLDVQMRPLIYVSLLTPSVESRYYCNRAIYTYARESYRIIQSPNGSFGPSTICALAVLDYVDHHASQFSCFGLLNQSLPWPSPAADGAEGEYPLVARLTPVIPTNRYGQLKRWSRMYGYHYLTHRGSPDCIRLATRGRTKCFFPSSPGSHAQHWCPSTLSPVTHSLPRS